jgi:tRNA-binding EMAP/Myf-like protein
MADISQYKVGIVLSVEEIKSNNNNKTLRSCLVNVGQENDEPVTIVTSASNVRPGSRVAVALAGSCVINEEGEEMTVKKTIVSGISSDGMLCDSRMLGWSGGAAGVAAQMPDSIPLGEAPPSTKPSRPNNNGQQEQQQQQQQQDATSAPGLFEKKLTKEEKKKLAEEKRKAKKAAKEAKSASEE